MRHIQHTHIYGREVLKHYGPAAWIEWVKGIQRCYPGETQQVPEKVYEEYVERVLGGGTKSDPNRPVPGTELRGTTDERL